MELEAEIAHLKEELQKKQVSLVKKCSLETSETSVLVPIYVSYLVACK